MYYKTLDINWPLQKDEWAPMSTFAPLDPILTPQPNKTKLPLQVLAVVEGNSEKIRFVG